MFKVIMKKFFENIFIALIDFSYLFILSLCLITALIAILAGAVAIPFIITNVVLTLCKVWDAPWWLYIVESLFGTIFIATLSLRFRNSEIAYDLYDDEYPYYIEGRDE